MARELVCVLSPVLWAPVPYAALPYGPKVQALGLAYAEVMWPLRDGARFVIAGERWEVAEIVYLPQPRLHDAEVGPPFVLTDEPLVYGAAMVYRDRHPVGGHLGFAELQNPEHVAMLEGVIGRRAERLPETLSEVGAARAESCRERDWRICWEVCCEVVAGINDGTIEPVYTARDRWGRVIHVACRIRIADLIAIERRRRDAGVILSSVADWYEPPERSAEAPLPEVPAGVDAADPGPLRNLDDGAATDKAATAGRVLLERRGEGRRALLAGTKEAMFYDWFEKNHPDLIAPRGPEFTQMRRDYEDEMKRSISISTMRRALGRKQ